MGGKGNWGRNKCSRYEEEHVQRPWDGPSCCSPVSVFSITLSWSRRRVWLCIKQPAHESRNRNRLLSPVLGTTADAHLGSHTFPTRRSSWCQNIRSGPVTVFWGVSQGHLCLHLWHFQDFSAGGGLRVHLRPFSWKKDQGTNLKTAVAQYSTYYLKTITCSCQTMAVKGLTWGRDWGLSSSTAKLSSPSLDRAASSIPLLTLGDAQGLRQAESAISSLITAYLQMSEELVMERPIGTLNLPSSWVLQMDVHHGRPFRNPGFWLENMVATHPPSRKAN